jgi:hypothetical protein
MFDLSFLNELLLDAGFNNCRELGPLESEVFGADELRKIQWENPENHQSLFVEAFKAKQ